MARGFVFLPLLVPLPLLLLLLLPLPLPFGTYHSATSRRSRLGVIEPSCILARRVLSGSFANACSVAQCGGKYRTCSVFERIGFFATVISRCAMSSLKGKSLRIIGSHSP